MKTLLARGLCCAGLCLPLALLRAEALPPELRTSLPAADLAGQATLRFWGLEIYQATLWVAPGFADAAYAQSPFALELRYQRDFKGADIAQRSLAEMQAQAPLSEAQAAAWGQRLRELFPDVQRGDRLTGEHQPAVGARFWHNGRWLGELRDPVFAERFFGIWLSPRSSEPQLRRGLLARTGAANTGRSGP